MGLSPYEGPPCSIDNSAKSRSRLGEKRARRRMQIRIYRRRRQAKSETQRTMKRQDTTPVRVNPRECRVSDEGRWDAMRSSTASRISESSGLEGVSRKSGGGPLSLTLEGTSLLASRTIFPRVQVIAISPTDSMDWNQGRHSPFFSA